MIGLFSEVIGVGFFWVRTRNVRFAEDVGDYFGNWRVSWKAKAVRGRAPNSPPGPDLSLNFKNCKSAELDGVWTRITSLVVTRRD